MSLRKIAKELGVSHAFLSQIKNGKRPLPEHLKGKLEALGAYHLLTTGKQSEQTATTMNGGIDKRAMGFEPTALCLGIRR